MRIALWSTSYFKGIGGAEKVVNDLVNYFSQSGIETYLIANRFRKDQQENDIFEPLHSAVKVYQNTFPNPLLSLHHPLIFVDKLFQYLTASVQFGFFLHKQKIQVIHLHLVNIDVLLLVFYKLLFRYRLVITFTGLEMELARSSRFSRFKVKIALKFADCVTAVSTDICERLKKRYNFQNILYIENGINRKTIQQYATQCTVNIKKDSFVYCGRLTPIKRVTFLIEAFYECVKKGCQKDLYIIGDGDDESKIKELITFFGIEDRVMMLGGLPHRQALGVINQCCCLLLSSLSEGCPMVVLEAMALGKPVIASDVGGLKDIVVHGKNGYLYSVDNQLALCHFMMMIAENKKKALEMGRNGIQTVTKKFDFNNIVNKYLHTYLR